jgi:DegV family protein with EDD domain
MSDQKIVVVTDSSAAYIPQEALGDLKIPIIPLWLVWDGERLRDGVDIDPPAFYERLETSKTIPTTSQPSPGEFIEFFREVATDADTIVGVFASSKLSGTVQSALAAQEQLPDIAIRVVDSLGVSMGQGFVALAAARAAAAGKSVDEVVKAAEDMRERVHFLFAVDTLEFLHRTGRIGGAKRWMGTALRIKPLLHFENGLIEPLIQIRTKRKALATMLDIAEERCGGQCMAEAMVIDVNVPDEADDVAQRVADRFGLHTVYRSTVSPVVGTNAGPGSVGLIFHCES